MKSTFTVSRFEAWARARNLYLISYAARMLIAASYVLLALESAQATAQRARRTAHYNAGVNADERALGQSLP